MSSAVASANDMAAAHQHGTVGKATDGLFTPFPRGRKGLAGVWGLHAISCAVGRVLCSASSAKYRTASIHTPCAAPVSQYAGNAIAALTPESSSSGSALDAAPQISRVVPGSFHGDCPCFRAMLVALEGSKPPMHGPAA